MKTNTRFTKRGLSMPTVLIFLMGFAMVGMTVMSLSVNTDKNSDRSNSKVQATLLAESGMYDLYDRIRSQMWADGSYPFSISNTNLTADTRLGKKVLGSYTARVINATSTIEDVVVNGSTIRRQNWSFDIGAVGTADSGIKSEVQGHFTGTTDLALQSITKVTAAPKAGKIYFPAAAIVANGQVKMTTDQGVRTTSADGHSAHVIGNKGMSWQTQSGSKAVNANTSVIDIQGMYMTGQTALSTTLSSSGLGNSGTTKNYRSPAIVGVPGLPDTPANTIVGLPRDVPFADQATTQTWINNWKETTAKPEATRFMGSLDATAVAQRPADQWRVLETPAYIDGDLKIPAGTQLRLLPKSSNPTENVVYIRGNVENLGELINLGVTVVVVGKYSDGPNAQYRLDTQGSPYPDRKSVLQNSAFVSVNSDAEAIQFTSDVPVTTGVVYSARGGIQVTGSLEINGMVLAYKDIDVAPQGGKSFVVNYERDAAGLGDFDPSKLAKIDISLVPAGIANPFLPSPITNWIQVR